MREDCLRTIHEIMRSGQSVEVEGMKRTLPSLEKVRAMLNDLENDIAQEELRISGKTRPRVRVVVPIDR